VTVWVPIVVSSAGGAVVSLLGVAAGGMVSRRSQKQHWSRDKELDACTQLISESTRTQFALLRHWRHGEPIDWTAWNEALDIISLIGASEVVTAASHVDQEFWLLSASILDGSITDTESWNKQRRRLEEARLAFVNTVRSKVTDTNSRLDRSPVARPAHLPDSFTHFLGAPPVPGEVGDGTAPS
jgi:hypothetical protein